jgi:hypothetical protein
LFGLFWFVLFVCLFFCETVPSLLTQRIELTIMWASLFFFFLLDLFRINLM